MKIIDEKEIRALRIRRKVTDEKGEKLNLFLKKPKVLSPPEERQIQVIEKLVSEIQTIVKANDHNAVVLLELIRKIQLPDYPEPAKEWEHTITRDSSGKAKNIVSKRTK